MLKKVTTEILPKQVQDFLKELLPLLQECQWSEKDIQDVLDKIMLAFLTRKKANFFIAQLTLASGVGEWVSDEPSVPKFFYLRAQHYRCGSYIVVFSSKKEYYEYNSFWRRELPKVELKDCTFIANMPSERTSSPNSI